MPEDEVRGACSAWALASLSSEGGEVCRYRGVDTSVRGTHNTNAPPSLLSRAM